MRQPVPEHIPHRSFQATEEQLTSAGLENKSPEATQLRATQSLLAQKLTAPTQKQENKTGMPNNLKMGVENLSGYDMSDVRVHYNSSKPAQLQAHAYAQGTDIHIASGQERHLPHEAWHVVQQKQGRVKPTMQLKGIGVNDDRELEKEADVMGEEALQLKTRSSASSSLITPSRNLNAKNIQQQKGVIQRFEDWGLLIALLLIIAIIGRVKIRSFLQDGRSRQVDDNQSTTNQTKRLANKISSNKEGTKLVKKAEALKESSKVATVTEEIKKDTKGSIQVDEKKVDQTLTKTKTVADIADLNEISSETDSNDSELDEPNMEEVMKEIKEEDPTKLELSLWLDNTYKEILKEDFNSILVKISKEDGIRRKKAVRKAIGDNLRKKVATGTFKGKPAKEFKSLLFKEYDASKDDKFFLDIITEAAKENKDNKVSLKAPDKGAKVTVEIAGHISKKDIDWDIIWSRLIQLGMYPTHRTHDLGVPYFNDGDITTPSSGNHFRALKDPGGDNFVYTWDAKFKIMRIYDFEKNHIDKGNPWSFDKKKDYKFDTHTFYASEDSKARRKKIPETLAFKNFKKKSSKDERTKAKNKLTISPQQQFMFEALGLTYHSIAGDGFCLINSIANSMGTTADDIRARIITALTDETPNDDDIVGGTAHRISYQFGSVNTFVNLLYDRNAWAGPQGNDIISGIAGILNVNITVINNDGRITPITVEGSYEEIYLCRTVSSDGKLAHYDSLT